MYYRINVSKLNKRIGRPFYEHYFATGENSVTDKTRAIELLNDFKKIFPMPLYKISMTRWETVGESFNVDELTNNDSSKELSKNQLKQLEDSTRLMLTKYSVELCLNAVTLNDEGFDACGVADALIGKWNKRTGNALINAGKDILSIME